MTAAGFLIDLTNFGDLAVLLPLTLAILAWLLWSPRKSKALWWMVAAALCVGGTGLLKVWFLACPPSPELQSPSGHTSLGTLVYGALFMLIAMKGRGLPRLAALFAGAAAILGIAASRVMLNGHTLLETGFGLAVGAMALAVFAWGYCSGARDTMPLRPLLLVVAVLVVFFHGRHLGAEELLRALGARAEISAFACAGRDAALPTNPTR